MPKELKSPRMKALLAKGVRRTRREPRRRPSDGMMRNLVYLTLNNGWHYQVEWAHDTRIRPKPYVVVYAFPPSHRGCESAPYFLMAV